MMHELIAVSKHVYLAASLKSLKDDRMFDLEKTKHAACWLAEASGCKQLHTHDALQAMGCGPYL